MSKIYTGDRIENTILRDINLCIDQKTFISIIGPSGSGKSTLLSLIGTLDRPTKGQIFFDSLEISKLKNRELADIRSKNIGFIFQQFHLIPSLTVLENVVAPVLTKKVSYNKEERAKNLLMKVGLGDKLSYFPAQLSGGQQQRVSIARALIQEPDWLLADEPTGNLDSKNSELVFSLIKELQEEKKMGVILVTHDLDLARSTKRMIEITDGEIVSDSGDLH